MSNDSDTPCDGIGEVENVQPEAIESLESPEETAVLSPPERCPVTGQFLKGNKGGGRPKGAKDKLNKQVIGTLERIWAARGDEIIEHLASEKPEVLAGLVARLIPQSLAAEAIEGEQKAQENQEVRITVVTKQEDSPALPAREVEGEVITHDESVGISTNTVQ